MCYPNSRPHITFDAYGVCSACRNAEEKTDKIDWSKRKKSIENIFDKFRSSKLGMYETV